MAQQAEKDECIYPIDQIKKVHEHVREEQPETQSGTTTKKLMRPGPGEELEG